MSGAVEDVPKLLPIARRGRGSRGQKIQLLTNHFPVKMPDSDGFFYHYSVKITYEDGRDVDVKGIGRKVLDKVRETYERELAGKQFAYDGEKALFTLGSKPCNKFEFTVALEEQRSERYHICYDVRVDKMVETVKNGLPGPPQLLLCILPERKNCDIYGPWKRRNLADLGVVTQCIAPTRLNDQYLTNVLLKINCKLGGLNSTLSIENALSIPLVSTVPTQIIGMDVSHGSPGRADVPSIAAVVSSRQWPSISHYRASVRTQSPKVEMIDGLFDPGTAGNEDSGMIRELLYDFYVSSGNRKPQHIIIFRDGVSESQFSQVLNIEFDQIKQACAFYDESWSPKFALIVAQKNHHTKFFQENSQDNIPPGTVIDNTICHPKNYDFYMCAHAGMIGTTRPTHYQVLHDEIGFSADDLQELLHSLSYVYQRSTTAISVVAPVCYAHLAASQMGQFRKSEDMSDASSSHGSMTSIGNPEVTSLPRLHKNVMNSMFFC